MARFDKGVTWYTRGRLSVAVAFPEDAVYCKYCPFLRADANGARFKCVINGEILYSIETVGDACPIEIVEVDKHGTSLDL